MIVLAAALASTGAILWHIYPEYRRLRVQDAATDRAAQHGPFRPLPQPLVAELYFARIVERKQRLVAISRELPAGLPSAQAALEELIRGEVPRGCDRPLPRGTEVRTVIVGRGLATVDFSEHLRSGFRGGSDNEGVTVYSIVNTLTSLPGIEEVLILIEGQPVTQIGGHLDVSQPLPYDDELVVAYP